MVNIVLVVAIVGFLLWVVKAFVPMDAAISKMLQVLVIVLLLVWVLQMLGLWPTGLFSVK